MNYPKISIRCSEYLDPIFTAWVKSHEKYKDWTPPPHKEIDDQVKKFKHEWSKYNNTILEGICSVTGLAFSRNEIDVFIVGGNMQPFSRPIVLKCRYSLMNFVNVLSHELIHCLFADNGKDVSVKALVPHENRKVSEHIVVDAILKFIFIDVLNEPERLEADIKYVANSTLGYDIAWKLVNEGDYKKILSDFKERIKK